MASEVRSLAGRSAEAAREIKALITDRLGRVEAGNIQVDRAGQTMQPDGLAGLPRKPQPAGPEAARGAQGRQGLAAFT